MFKTDLFLRPKTLYVFLLCLFSFAYTAKAQEQNAPKQDTIKRYKWEVATDLLWLIDKNTVPRFSVFGRKNITTKNGKHNAWRLRVMANYSLLDDLQGVDSSSHYKYWNYDLMLRLGYEWQKTHKNFQLNYGADIHFLWKRQDADIFEDRVSPNGGILDDRLTRYEQTWEGGVIGFIGAKYFITSRWMISTEANFSVIYQKFNILGESHWSDNVLGTGGKRNGYARLDRKSINLNFNPIYVLQISYLFN